MAIKVKVLRSGEAEITQNYKGSSHYGIDLVKKGYMLDYISAHSAGVVTQVIASENLNTPTNPSNPGNMVKIDHGNGYHTRYLHLAYNTVKVKVGQKVSAGEVIGYMGNTGYSFGGHLHFEVFKGNTRIDPTPYLNKDFESIPQTTKDVSTSYKIGDVVVIDGVYISSTSEAKLTPAITKGTITKIVSGARNPYLLNYGNIGWINESCIVKKNDTYKTVSNCEALNLRSTPCYGNNIYTSVPKGTKVIYIGIENGWAKINYNNKTLYCGSSYLK